MNTGKYSKDRMIIHPVDKAEARFTIKGAQAQEGAISGRLFGNFLEHLGFATQGGILAQALSNPTLTFDDNIPEPVRIEMARNGLTLERIALMGAERARDTYGEWAPRRGGTGFSVAVMDDMKDMGIPFPWKAEPVIYAKGRQKGRVGHSVLLTPRDCEVTLSQGVFLSQHRILTYEGHIWARSNQDIGIKVRLAKRAGEVLAERALESPTGHWTKQAFLLELPEGALKFGEPVDFQIVASGNGEVYIDRACLSPTDHIRGFDPEMLALTKKYAPPVLRAPGGNFVSGYHFWHGIGDIDYRQTFKNPAWNGIETNFFGPDEFMALCELIGSEPHIVINLGDGIPEEAAAWVEYMNGPATSTWGAKRAANGHPEPYNVRLWEVGNEIYGEWQVGHCGDSENARRYRETAKAMLAVDPGIELIANGSEFDFYNLGMSWNKTLMKEGGDTLDCISLHALPSNRDYAPSRPIEDNWLALQSQPSRWERVDLPDMIDAARELCPGKNITFAITEWGILGDAPLNPSVANSGDSVYGASFYNICLRLKEHIKESNATALYHGGCVVKVGPYYYVDPQMDVIKRYTEFTGGLLYPVEYSGPVYQVARDIRTIPATPDIAVMDAVCARTLYALTVIALVNRDPSSDYPVELKLEGDMAGLSVASCEVQQGAGMSDVNTPLIPDKVAFRPLPAEKRGDTVLLNAPPRSVIFITLS